MLSDISTVFQLNRKRNVIYFVCGHPNTGKTTLAFQFLECGSKNREKKIFITLREPKKNFLYRYNSRKYQIYYFPGHSLKSELFLKNLRTLLSDKEKIALVIDNISAFTHDKRKGTNKFYYRLISLLKETPKIRVLITGDAEGLFSDFRIVDEQLVKLADVVILLRLHNKENKIERAFCLLKSVDKTLEQNYFWYPYTITKSGFFLSSVEEDRKAPAFISRKALLVLPEILYFSSEEENAVVNWIKKYNQNHPENPVCLPKEKIRTILDYYSLLDSFEKGNTLFSLLPLDLYRLAEFAEKDLIYPLDEFFTSDLKNQYLSQALAECTYKGRIYAIPQYINIGVLLYRKDILSKYDFLSPPSTWQELIEISKKIIKKEKQLYGFGFQGAQFENLSCNFLEFLWCNNGDVFDAAGKVIINNIQATETLAFLRDTIYKHKITPIETPFFLEAHTEKMFLSGKLVFLRGWPRTITQAHFPTSKVNPNDIDFIPIPVGPHGRESIPVIGSYGYVIPKTVREPERVWRFFLDFFTPEIVIEFSIKGWTCPTQKFAYSDRKVLHYRPYYSLILDLLPKGRSRRNIFSYPLVTQLIRREIHLVLRNEKEPKIALDTIAKELHHALHKWVHTPHIQRALSYIEDHLHNPDLNRDEVAHKVSLSPSYFSVLFFEITGRTFTDYLTHARIEKAKTLLTNPTLPISIVAKKVGFRDESYFTLIFKKLTGITPSRYRLELQGPLLSL